MMILVQNATTKVSVAENNCMYRWEISGNVLASKASLTVSKRAALHRKKYKKKDRDLLIGHLNKQRTSLADTFFSDPADEQRKNMKRKEPEKGEAEGKNDGTKPPRKRKKTFDADNDGPQYFQKMNTDIEKLEAKLELVDKNFDRAKEELQKVPEDCKVKDPAMLGYIKKLQFRHQLLMKFRGSDEVTKLFNTYQKEGDPTPTPALCPVDDSHGAPETPKAHT